MTSRTENKVAFEWHSNGIRMWLTCLLGITGPKSLRIELGMAQSEIGKELGLAHPNGHGGKPFKQCTISNYETGGYRMTHETEKAYRVLLERWVAEKTDGRMIVKVRFGRRWRITPLMVCECGRTFRFRQVTQKKCRACRRSK